MTPRFGIYSWTTVVLISLAIAIMVILLVTNRGDLTSATLVLVAFSSFLIGLFILLLNWGDYGDQKLAAAMVVPYTSTFSRILADLGVQGYAHFINVSEDRTFPVTVMQFNPVIGTIPERLGENYTFYTGIDSPGILTIPSGNVLLEMVEHDKAIILPASEPKLLEALREVYLDLLEIADNALVTRSGNEIVVALKNFKLIDGCIKIRDDSSRNCITAPCPVCSLAGIIIAKGLGKTCVMQEIVVDKETGSVEIHIGVNEPILNAF